MKGLTELIADARRHALEAGALLPIETRCETVCEQGQCFLLRTLSSLRHKDEAASRLKQAGETCSNPFLPHDPDLYVADAGPDHLCLLNKFNVIDHHILIVTRAFESQQALINRRDFFALATVLHEVDGLAFYNGGTLAGASQPHKHLQLIPLTADSSAAFPLLACYNQHVTTQPAPVAGLPFAHAAVALPDLMLAVPEQAAGQLLLAYLQLREQLQLDDDAPYNLLVTRRWMVMVARSGERCEGVSLNALAFAGTLLVRNQEEAQRLKAYGLMRTLAAVAMR